MSQTVLLITLLLVSYATQSLVQTAAQCNEDVSLTCKGDFDTIDFALVTWYKVNNTKKLGIIRRGKDDSSIKSYNFTRTPAATFGEKYKLLLQRVTPEDSGHYMCAIYANVGGKVQYLYVDLEVGECEPEPELTTITTMFNTTVEACQERVEDLPVKWSVVGSLALGLFKITLCLLSIWVLATLHSRHGFVAGYGRM